jgi:hypothetical protein
LVPAWIGEPLLSFDPDTSSVKVKVALNKHERNVATVRMAGRVAGYVSLSHLDEDGACGRFIRNISPDQMLAGEAGFAEVIHVLTHHD